VLLFWADEAEEPAHAAHSRWTGPAQDDAVLPRPVVAGVWITVVSILFGAMVLAVVAGIGTALGWALCHTWARPGGHVAGSASGEPTVPGP
jgi:hypothetical protein